jgi:hypothetical protein
MYRHAPQPPAFRELLFRHRNTGRFRTGFERMSARVTSFSHFGEELRQGAKIVAAGMVPRDESSARYPTRLGAIAPTAAQLAVNFFLAS